MSGPITWRNVEGPSFRDINQGMVNSAAMFTNAFSGLKDVLKEREATDLANWEAMKERNTTDILTRAAAAATPEEAKALKAELLGRMQGMGAQVDSRVVLPVVQGMEAKLQDQAIKAMQYTTQTQQFAADQADREHLDRYQAIQGIFAGAKTQGELEAGANAMQALLNAGQITPRQVSQLATLRSARGDNLIKQGNEAAQVETGRISANASATSAQAALARAEADKVTAQQTAERLLLEAYAKTIKSQSDFLEQTNATVQAAKNNPYLRTLNSSDKDREAFRSSLKDKGLKAPEIDALIEKVTTTPFYVTDKATGKKVAIEPSISALQNVLNSRESWLGGNLFGAADRNYVSAIQNYIDTQPDYYTNLAAAQRNLALVSQRAPNPEQGNQGTPANTAQATTTSAPVANAAADPASPSRAAATSIWGAKANQAQDSYSRMYREKEANRLAQAQAEATAGKQIRAQLQAGLNGVFPNNPQLAQLEKELKDTVSNEAKLREQYGGKMYDQKVSRLQSKIDGLRQPAATPTSASPAASPVVNALDKAAEAAASKPSVYENGTLTFGADKKVNVSAAPGVNFKGFGGNGTKIRFGDADTLEISGSGGEKVKLRSFNIDGVESDQKLGKEAKQLVEGLISNAANVQVVISDSKKEKNGRQLGDIFVDGQSLNKLMISAGYAQVLPGKISGMSPAEEREMLALQQEAQLAKRGQWRLKPWESISPALHRAWGDTLTPPELRK